MPAQNSPTPLKIIVASTNLAKISAVESAFAEVFEQALDVSGLSVASEVPDQPMSDAETLLGARNHAKNAHTAQPDANFWVGLRVSKAIIPLPGW